MKRNKYNAVKAKLNGITFDSHFEALVYEHLVHLFGNDRIICQQPYTVIEPAKYFPMVQYYVDFLVKSNSGLHPLLVEAKGCMTTDWLLKYKLLWEKHPVIAKNLIVIFPTKRHRQKRGIYARIPQMISLPELPDYLRGRRWI
jgi:hypothetical protein